MPNALSIYSPGSSDLDAGIIVDVEVTPANRTEEVDATKTMIERVEKRFDLKPKRLVGDTDHGAAPILNWIVDDKQIAAHPGVGEVSGTTESSATPSCLTPVNGRCLRPGWNCLP